MYQPHTGPNGLTALLYTGLACVFLIGYLASTGIDAVGWRQRNNMAPWPLRDQQVVCRCGTDHENPMKSGPAIHDKVPDSERESLGTNSEVQSSLSASALAVFSQKPYMSDSCENVLASMGPFCADVMSSHKCTLDYSEATLPEYTPPPDGAELPEADSCKTLWFAGFHMGFWSKCIGDGAGYREEYEAALASWKVHAQDVLQPVLVLAWQGVTNDTDKAFMTGWAEQHGVIVINVESFSFQDALDESGIPAKAPGRAGAFMRLDIPAFVEENNLFDLPGVCGPEVLYTDSDVLFMNPISHKDMQVIKQGVRRDNATVVSYGPERAFQATEPTNTGVMIMHVDRFRDEWPKMLQFAKNRDEFPGHDQALLNEYFVQEGLRHKYIGMPVYWNWKAYWPIDLGVWPKLKVLHTHGPKPIRGLWRMADCDLDIFESDLQIHLKKIAVEGMCCNRGVVANRYRDIMRASRELGVCQPEA